MIALPPDARIGLWLFPLREVSPGYGRPVRPGRRPPRYRHVGIVAATVPANVPGSLNAAYVPLNKAYHASGRTAAVARSFQDGAPADTASFRRDPGSGGYGFPGVNCS